MTLGSIWRSDPAPLLRGLAYERQPGLLALGVDALELGPRHEHLAARLERRGLGQAAGDDRDRPQVRGHVLAGRPVAAGRTLGEPAALVAQADREAVDLELGDVAQLRGRLRGGRQSEPAPHPAVERPQLVVAEGVRQRQHRPDVADLVEGAGRRAADPLGRRIRGRQLRVGRLERDELAEQRVVLGVADLRRVLDVVELVGTVDRGRELGVTPGGGVDVEPRRGVDEGGVDRRELDRHGCEGTQRSGARASRRRVRRRGAPTGRPPAAGGGAGSRR